ncbi:ABC transporter substrate-binding protein [Streptomyces sp. NPDC016469]|uniref:ABC transporter substrate-binding protein n=1 Tax=Streptomyces sp. NPDC016469 TaxID=3157191 RepID=UPI0033C3F57E
MSRRPTPSRLFASSPTAALAAALVLPLTATACSGASGAPGKAASTPRSGGHLRFAMAADPGCVDPHQATTTDALYGARAFVDSLTDQNPRTGQIVPWIARSWQVSSDASRFTFSLRTDATFADGTPLDAKAVKANLDAVAALGAKSMLGAGYLQGYRSTEVVDRYTAKVTFKGPNEQFLQATSTATLGLLAPASLKLPADRRCTAELIGSGPFTLDGYTPNTSVELTRRDGYQWGSPLWKHSGAAYLDKLSFRVVPEAGVRSGSLNSGQVEAIAGVAPQDQETLAGRGLSILDRPNPGVPVALSVNTARPLTKDPAVRRALQSAVDRDEVVKTVLSPSYLPATSALSSSTGGYADNSALLAHDPERTRQTLNAAGWVPGPDGIRVKNGKKLNLKVILGANFGPNQTVLELIQQQLRKTGIGLTLTLLSLPDYQQARGAGDYDLAWGNGTRNDPDILRTAFSGKLLNLGRIDDPRLERSLDAQAAASDPEKRAALVATAQRRVLEQGYQIPVFEMASVYGIGEKVHGLTLDSTSYPQFHDAWLS